MLRRLFAYTLIYAGALAIAWVVFHFDDRRMGSYYGYAVPLVNEVLYFGLLSLVLGVLAFPRKQ